jgi:hypothetical protein
MRSKEVYELKINVSNNIGRTLCYLDFAAKMSTNYVVDIFRNG